MAPLSTDRVSAFEQLQLRSSLIGNTFYKTLGGGSQSCRAWCLCGRLARSHQCRRRIDVSTNISFFDLCDLYEKLAPPNSTKVYQFTRRAHRGSMSTARLCGVVKYS